MLDKLKCTQCGATAFDELPGNQVRCQYCQTTYVRRNEPASSTGARVVIGKGAHVVFGANAKVVIKGKLEIEDGADVQINGSLELVEPGDPVLIQQARDRVSRGD